MATILVCGGRDYANRDCLFRVLSNVAAAYVAQGEPVTVIHGGSSGADAMAGEWAKSSGVCVREYPAEWDREGRAAGPMRNSRMLREGRPDIVVAFPGGRGTADMVRKARGSSVPVYEVEGE